MSPTYFQDHMPGNLCFGCGSENQAGLQIHSSWDGDEAVCEWSSQPRFQGWKGLMNGGILATLIDCHCMGTAMAAAYRSENRELGSEPYYRYATARIAVDYLKPTPNDRPITLRAQVVEISGRKVRLTCQAIVDGVQTAKAEVVGVRVFEGQPSGAGAFG
jgi:acyl-coenzyme A thioesterase PaaI-like protein